jgi:hypothetical protein
MSQFFYIPKQSDKKIVDAFWKAQGIIGGGKIVAEGYAGATFSLCSPDGDAQFTDIVTKKQRLFRNITLYFLANAHDTEETCPFFIRMERTISELPFSPYFDKIVLNGYLDGQGRRKILDKERLEIISSLQKSLCAFTELPENGSDKLNLEAAHHAVLLRLEDVATGQIERQAEFTREKENEFSTRKTQFERECIEKQEKIEQELQRERSELEEQKRILDERAKELDDRNNTHVRREIRQNIQAAIKERFDNFGLSRDTKNLALPIKRTCSVLFLGFVLGALLSGWELNQLEQQIGTPDLYFYLTVLRTFLLSLAASATAIYYLKWHNRLFDQHSQSEFALKQLTLDIDRASWVVETALEWHNAHGTDIPELLLKSIAHNLFSNADKQEPVTHPADELASALLGSAASAKIKAGNAEIEFDRKGLKGMQER